ncbi:S-formylglutathione hydrolase FrmB [Friedmanniella luteola]|uniref:S-formylglutathione hydrolase FrmB n=1 Tax=Friedmanniella luteola TaxID=546871 RepID=A0A1H1QTA5_9ACTN|nr:alpha/beta hydrolase family protein [Friedmanniella luteola]SDS26710.1 S-formylglutathione hydrolase FrmB [Friedmanniella luteola]
MAHLRCDFYSDALALSTSMTVLLPQPTTTQIGLTGQVGSGPPPVLYLLHGLSDDDTTWLRRTSIERYVSELGWAVVMPQVHRSFYTDEHDGGAFWTFVSEELPALVDRFFRVSTARADTFVAGLSMGGYGALKLALRQPDRFAAAASLSGALDLAALAGRAGVPPSPDHRMFTRILGPGGTVAAEDDLLALARRADPARLPALHLSCGTEDALLASNHAFAAVCAEAGIPLTTAFPPGEHEWGLWDTGIVEVLAFFAGVRQAAADAEVEA